MNKMNTLPDYQKPVLIELNDLSKSYASCNTGSSDVTCKAGSNASSNCYSGGFAGSSCGLGSLDT